jgi:hypothetical protein
MLKELNFPMVYQEDNVVGYGGIRNGFPMIGRKKPDADAQAVQTLLHFMP